MSDSDAGKTAAITVRSLVARVMSRQPIASSRVQPLAARRSRDLALVVPSSAVSVRKWGRASQLAIDVARVSAVIGRPAVIELMDHLGFVERNVASSDRKSRRNALTSRCRRECIHPACQLAAVRNRPLSLPCANMRMNDTPHGLPAAPLLSSISTGTRA